MNFLDKKYLDLYRQIQQKEKNELFFLNVKNLVRTYDKNMPNEISNYLESLFGTLDDSTKLVELTQEFLSEKEPYGYKIEAFADIVDCVNSYSWGKKDNFFSSALSVNLSLFLSDFPPLVLFAFNRELVSGKIDKEYLADLLELTYTLLLRPIKLPFEIEPPLNTHLMSDQGSSSNVYIDKSMIYKVPKSLIAYAFLAEQEHSVYNQLRKTDLKKFIFSECHLMKSSILVHNYIDGKSGEDFLEKEGQILSDQRASLKEFYDLYMSNYYFEKFLLDIHPGNFIWSETKSQWFLIDCGSIPKIGYEYYIFDSFDEYFLKVWLTRNRQKEKIPIRSFDYAMDLNIVQNEYKNVTQLLERD